MQLFKPYKLSLQQVANIIEEVLTGSMDCRNWDNFICIPINGNADMEKIRAKCEALSYLETIEPSGKIQHAEPARLELLKILVELQSAI